QFFSQLSLNHLVQHARHNRRPPPSIVYAFTSAPPCANECGTDRLNSTRLAPDKPALPAKRSADPVTPTTLL
ncbi:MAG: hypothetical protein U0223_09115, partial [Nitrospira sp.]